MEFGPDAKAVGLSTDGDLVPDDVCVAPGGRSAATWKGSTVHILKLMGL